MRWSLLAAILVGLALAGCIDNGNAVHGDNTTPDTPLPPLVTVAHIDTGVNPYHVSWQTDEPFATAHPSTYIPGYPADARALNLTLNAPSYTAALDADQAIWDDTEPDILYYVPGTRLVGLINLNQPVAPDDHGHGTMTATRSTGPASLAPEARFVSVQGLGAGGVRWVAEQDWIDVQTNSWGSLVPLPGVPGAAGTPNAIRDAATRMPVIFASGNGNGFNGAGMNPTWLQQTAPPGAIQVGGHDNGHLTLWHGQPAHVVADYYGGIHAPHDAIDGLTTAGIACCTSASAPYAAGGMAAIILEARTRLGDTTPGITDGANGERILAERGDTTTLPLSGPLSDGLLTLDEAIRLYLVTAQAMIHEGPHDGARHWATDGEAPDPTNPAGNPYCQLCWGTPIEWHQVPPDAPAFVNRGYGSIDPWSVEQATGVLRGETAAPERTLEDEWFALDAAVREALNP